MKYSGHKARNTTNMHNMHFSVPSCRLGNGVVGLVKTGMGIGVFGVFGVYYTWGVSGFGNGKLGHFGLWAPGGYPIGLTCPSVRCISFLL